MDTIQPSNDHNRSLNELKGYVNELGEIAKNKGYFKSSKTTERIKESSHSKRNFIIRNIVFLFQNLFSSEKKTQNYRHIDKKIVHLNEKIYDVLKDEFQGFTETEKTQFKENLTAFYKRIEKIKDYKFSSFEDVNKIKQLITLNETTLSDLKKSSVEQLLSTIELATTIESIPADQREEVVHQAYPILDVLNQVNENDKIMILKTVASLSPQERQGVIEYALPFIRKMEYPGDIEIIFSIIRTTPSTKRQEISHTIQTLLEGLHVFDRSSALRMIQKIVPHQREEMLTQSHRILQGVQKGKENVLLFMLGHFRDKKNENDLMLPLLEKMHDGAEMADLWNVFQAIPVLERKERVEEVLNVFPHAKTASEFASALHLIQSIPAEQRKEGMEQALPLFEGIKENHQENYMVLWRAFQRLPVEHRVPVMQLVPMLKHSHYQAQDAFSRSNFLGFVQRLLPKNPEENFSPTLDVDHIWHAFKSISPADQTSIIQESLPLLQNIQNLSIRAQIVQVISQVPSEQRQEVVGLANLLLPGIGNQQERIEVLKTIRDIPFDQRESIMRKTQLVLSENQLSIGLSPLLRLLKAIPPQKLDVVIEGLKFVPSEKLEAALDILNFLSPEKVEGVFNIFSHLSLQQVRASLDIFKVLRFQQLNGLIDILTVLAPEKIVMSLDIFNRLSPSRLNKEIEVLASLPSQKLDQAVDLLFQQKEVLANQASSFQTLLFKDDEMREASYQYWQAILESRIPNEQKLPLAHFIVDNYQTLSLSEENPAYRLAMELKDFREMPIFQYIQDQEEAKEIMRMLQEVPLEDRKKILYAVKDFLAETSLPISASQLIGLFKMLPPYQWEEGAALFHLLPPQNFQEVQQILKHKRQSFDSRSLLEVVFSHEALRKDSYSYWQQLFESDLPAQEKRSYADFILANEQALGLLKEDPLHQLTLVVSILCHPESLSNPKNPNRVFNSLKAITSSEQPINVDTSVNRFQEKNVQWNLSTLRSKGNFEEYTSADLPPDVQADTLEKLFDDLEKRIKALPSDRKKKINEYITSSTGNSLTELRDNLLRKHFIPSLLSVQREKNSSIHTSQFQIYSVLKAIIDQPHIVAQGEVLSPQEDMLLKMSASIQKCSTGQRDGLENFYQLLSVQYRKGQGLTDSNESKAEAFVDDQVQKALSELFANQKLLQTFTKQNPVEEAAHVTLYLKNRYHKQLGYKHKLTFDLYTSVLSNEVLDISAKEGLNLCLQHLKTKNVVDRLVVASSEMFKAGLYMGVSALLEKVEPRPLVYPDYIEFDEDTNPIKLTPKGAFALLKAAHYLNEVAS